MPSTTELPKTKANTTYNVIPGEGGSVVLYSTEIVRWDREHITLRHGGHKTVTTKTRMNQVASVYGLPFRVYADRGAWKVRLINAKGETLGEPLDFDRSSITFPRHPEAEKRYNGWTNRATWNVALWVGNEEGLYRAMHSRRRSLASFDAERAETFARQAWPDGVTPDGDSLDRVNWQAIADAWNEE